MTLWLLLTLLASLKSCQAETGYFWQMNDYHYDHTYWTKQESCFEKQGRMTAFGNGDCDPPWELVESSVKAMKKHGPDPDFIVWFGDTPPHFIKNSNLGKEAKLEAINNVSMLIREVFPDTTVLPLPGNHDYQPKNYMESGGSDFYNRMAESWQPWFDDNVTEQFKKGGFYSKMISQDPPVKAIVPNTNLYNKGNPLYQSEADPGDQFAWIRAQLDDARKNEQMVYVFLHISPGYREATPGGQLMHPQQNDELLSILQSNTDVILAVFAAHTHKDSFRVIYRDKKPSSFILLTPSVSPWQRRSTAGKKEAPRHPGIRRYFFDRATYRLADYQQFYLNITVANEEKTDEWKHLYNFTKLYDVDDISPDVLQDLLDDLRQPKSKLFPTYLWMNTAKGGKAVPDCDKTCTCGHLCAIAFMKIQDYNDCFHTCVKSTSKGTQITGGVLMVMAAALSRVVF